MLSILDVGSSGILQVFLDTFASAFLSLLGSVNPIKSQFSLRGMTTLDTPSMQAAGSKLQS
jgi:hypothetical protein